MIPQIDPTNDPVDDPSVTPSDGSRGTDQRMEFADIPAVGPTDGLTNRFTVGSLG